MSSRRAAVIDMGTNTFHLLLVEIDGISFKTIYKEKIPVKLGKGGINQNLIADDAKKRALHTLRHFKNIVEGEKIPSTFAFATSSVRNADNGKSFVREIKETLDIEVRVLTGEEEAQMIYEGIRLTGSLNGRTELMMDIGGGSVEFIIGNNEEALWRQSFEIGGQRLLDLFHDHDPILPEELDRLESYLREKLQPLLYAINTYKPTGITGASGTFDTLMDIYFESMLQCKLTGSHVFELPIRKFNSIHREILGKTKEQRLLIPGMAPMRVDMIVVASSLIEFILQHIHVDYISCSHYALKEGAIATLLIHEQPT